MVTWPAWVEAVFAFSLDLNGWQELGLAFLLGSFAVATWSDLKHLSAQREFLEVWLFFVLAVLAFDAYRAGFVFGTFWQVTAVKWGLIAAFSVASFERTGPLFRLARADVAALAAAASLLTPVLIVLFYASAKGIALAVGPMLRRGRPYWPFMPVVSLATILVLALGFAVSGG